MRSCMNWPAGRPMRSHATPPWSKPCGRRRTSNGARPGAWMAWNRGRCGNSFRPRSPRGDKMPRLQVLLNSFVAGEVTPRLRGRVDLAKYNAACECLHNYLVLPQGGVTRRPGTKWMGEVKTSTDGCVRLLKLEPSSVSSYVLEFGCLYMRVYKNNARINYPGGAAFEMTTPYAIADVFGIQPVPSIDVLYLFHPDYQTRKLQRYADDCWKLQAVPLDPPPSLEVGARPQADIQPSAISGDTVTLTAFNCNAFVAADKDREVLFTGGCNAGARAGIASVTSAKAAVVNVCVPFVNTNVTCANLWRIPASPLTKVTPGSHEPVGKVINLTATANAWRGVVNGFGAADGDCEKFVLLNGGSFQIRKVTSATVAQATIRGAATPTTAAAAESGNWTLEEALFSSCNGWAITGAFHDGRLYTAAGHRFAASKTGDYENYAPGSVDDDGLLFALDSDVLEHIRWMRGGRKGFLIGTLSSEWEAIGSTDAPITASNIQVRKQTTHGSSRVPPIHVGPATIFVARGGRQLRELAFVFEVDGYQAPDLLLLAEHLTRRSTASGTDPTIIDLAYQQRPEPRLWAVRSDGVLLCCTYLRDQNIVAWSRLTTQGWFESVTVIAHPDGDRDQVWVAVRRTINGATKRYIEYFDDTGSYYPTLNVDAAYVCTSSKAFKTFCGLSHLECSTVQIVADVSVRPSTTVVGGNISFDSPCATKVEVGLAYTSGVATMRPGVPIGGMSSMPAKLSWVRLVIKVLDTLGMNLRTASGEEIVPFRTAADCMGFAPALFSGDKDIPHLR